MAASEDYTSDWEESVGTQHSVENDGDTTILIRAVDGGEANAVGPKGNNSKNTFEKNNSAVVANEDSNVHILPPTLTNATRQTRVKTTKQPQLTPVETDSEPTDRYRLKILPDRPVVAVGASSEGDEVANAAPSPLEIGVCEQRRTLPVEALTSAQNGAATPPSADKAFPHTCTGLALDRTIPEIAAYQALSGNGGGTKLAGNHQLYKVTRNTAAGKSIDNNSTSATAAAVPTREVLSSENLDRNMQRAEPTPNAVIFSRQSKSPSLGRSTTVQNGANIILVKVKDQDVTSLNLARSVESARGDHGHDMSTAGGLAFWSLTIHQCHLPSFLPVAGLLHHLGNLCAMEITGCSGLALAGLERVLADASCLRTLTLRSCGLLQLPPLMSGSIEVLDVSDNALKDATGIETLFRLNKLNLAGNYLCSLTDLRPLVPLGASDLQQLGLAGNPVQEVPR